MDNEIETLKPITTKQEETVNPVKEEEFDITEENIVADIKEPTKVDKTVDPYIKTSQTDLSNLDKELDKVNPIFHPTGTEKQYKEFTKKIENLTAEERDKLTDIDRKNITITASGESATITNNVYADFVNNAEILENNVEYGDKKLNTRTLKIGSNVTSLNKASLIARLNATSGVGEVVQVPLWHSGFWITLAPVKQQDFINLSIELNSNQIQLGRATSGLIYSNYSVVFTRIITDFIIKHMKETTLKLDEDDDIRDYIMVQDLYPLVNGLLCSTHFNGIDIIKSCVNSLVLDDNGKPKCEFTVMGKIDPKKLLYVNRSKLNNVRLSQMAKRTPGSVSKDEAREYIREAYWNKEERLDIDSPDTKYHFYIKAPTLLQYINKGEEWVNNVIKDVEEILTKDDSQDVKDSKTSDMLLASRTNIYNSYLNRLESEVINQDGVFVKGPTIEGSDSTNIKAVLDAISNDIDKHKLFVKTVTSYINNNVVAIIATPNFVCPVCKESQSDQEGAFKEFIPLNVLENFFALGSLRLSKMREDGL